MQRLRCTLPENSYTIKGGWNKKHLRWYFPQAHYHSQKVKEIIRAPELLMDLEVSLLMQITLQAQTHVEKFML
ncbi:unnamed protein product, partial [Callosobruchus maculatus]